MRHFRETIYKRVFTILAFASLLFLTGIVLTLFVEAYPFLVSHDISRTLFGLY